MALVAHGRLGECHTVAVASSSTRKRDLFAFLVKRGVVPMFVTWELLLLFAGFILALLTYIDKKK